MEPSAKLEVPLTLDTLGGAGIGAAAVLVLWLISGGIAAWSSKTAMRALLDTAKSFAVASVATGALAGLVIAAALRCIA